MISKYRTWNGKRPDEMSGLLPQMKTLEEVTLFSENLYTSTNNGTNEDFQEFTTNVNQQMPKLSREQCNEIEGKLTLHK